MRRQFRGSFSGYERDRAYYQADGESRRLFDAGYVFGVDLDTDGRSALPLDIDGDGDLDLAILSLQGLHLFENRAPRRSFARISLGAGPSAAVLGAQVALTAGGVTQRGHVALTEGFQTQVSHELHFGLGGAERVERLEVRWPDGELESWTDLPVDRLLVVTRGGGEVAARELPAWPPETRPLPREAPSPLVELESLDGERTTLAQDGLPTVVNFWAPWCAPCQQELPELAALSVEFADQVRFVGVSVETADRESVRAAVADFGLDYTQVLADEAVLETFHGQAGSAALPSTFVFDATGRLVRVWRRPLAREDLEQLLVSLRDEPPTAGDWYDLAQARLRSEQYEGAAEALLKAYELDPQDYRVHLRLGELALGGERSDLALEHFQRAVQLEPRSAQAHYELGILLSAIRPYDGLVQLSEAVRLRGDAPGDLRELVKVAEQVDHIDALGLALELHDRIIAGDPGARAWTDKGMLLGRRRRYADAVTCFETALGLDPDYTRAQKALATARRKL